MKKKTQGQVVIYQAKGGAIEFRSDSEKETLWASINQIADLFGVQKAAVSKHLKNIFETEELSKKATVSILETVQSEGSREVRRRIEMFNLDAIIAVGYRINSKNATQFRIWATKTLRQYVTRGFVIDKKRIAHNHDQFLQAVEDMKKLLLVKKTIGFISAT